MIILKLIVIIISSCSLISLSYFLFLASKGRTLTIWRIFNCRDDSWTAKKQRTFLVFSGIGFLVCMYNGADAMLYWMPDSWGNVNVNDGEYYIFRETLASIFGFAGGIALFQIMESAAYDNFAVRISEQKVKALEKILNAGHDNELLEGLKSGFQKKVEELQIEINKLRTDFGYISFLYPENDEVLMYKNLIQIIGRKQEKKL